MAVPDFQSLMLPLLRIAPDGNEHSLAEARKMLSAEFKLALLYAMDGGIHRLGFDSHKALRPISDARKLIDLRDLSFVARPSPFEAKDWSAAIRIDGQDW